MKALITGVTGQDGHYLSQLLLSKGYEVHGLVRRTSQGHDVPAGVLTHDGDLCDSSSLHRVVHEVQPDEVYNLAAQSDVGLSFRQPESTMDITGLGCMRLLEAVLQHAPNARFYQASSSEMFGDVKESPQNENTALKARSPYGVAKIAAHLATIHYREAYGLHASSGVLYNHESKRRGFNFVTRKITYGAAMIECGVQDKIELGNIDAIRDWGHAADYVRAMWLMLQQDESDDYIVATGIMHTVRDVLDVAFDEAGLGDWRPYVVVSDEHKRPSDVPTLCGDASKARRVLGWEPTVTFEQLIREMVRGDMRP